MAWTDTLDGSMVGHTAPALAPAVRPKRLARPSSAARSHRVLVYRAVDGLPWCAPCVLSDWSRHTFPGEALPVGTPADCARCGRGIY